MKKITFLLCFIMCTACVMAQGPADKRNSKQEKRAEKKQRVNALIRQEEEGVLSFTKQSAGGAELRTNGYGIFYEHQKMISPRFSSLYAIELTEIKHPKEEKLGTGNFFANTFVYGKVNNFFQVKLGYGEQYVLGQRGNKNGVAITAIGQAGLSVGLLKPYYLQIDDNTNNGVRDVKYNSTDSSLFLDPSAIVGGSGFGKGWSELKVRPGAYAKAALRFDFGHYNESLEALEIGFSVEAYAQKIQIMALNPSQQLFYQGHIAFVFGRRK